MVVTESGTTYLIEAGQVTRLVSDAGGQLRRDGEPINLLQPAVPVVGERMELLLEPLSEEAFLTWRSTSPVTAIVEEP